MSRAAVEQVVGKLLIDSEFRNSVRSDGASALAGYDLTDEERERVLQAEPQFEEAARTLDTRVTKLGPWLP